MAEEIKFTRDDGEDYNVIIRRYSDMKYWNGEGFYNLGATSKYQNAIEAALRNEDDGENCYVVDWPTGITTAGVYIIEVYKQASGNPSANDEYDGSFIYEFDGEAEVDPLIQDKAAKIRANKARQDKSTGTVTIRNNDDTHDAFEMTLTDNGSSITREVGSI